ncbi:hypothetical protein DPX16_14163 [Anabarilius grahami]|uniref:Uncharacterized protein n=1 Tax=Anabarilius grahami TaxID=495550 RepID=A0A3N0XGK5_ANAGA|nr:hypothetical protein DPX16_14163 [Anabarilius grahami]
MSIRVLLFGLLLLLTSVISLSTWWQPCPGASIHKVVEEKLHKQNRPERMQATATKEAYIDERLCKEVRKYPHLYNCSMKEYKDVYMGCNSWREIVQNCSCVDRQCILTSQMTYTLQGYAFDCAHTQDFRQ